MTKTFSLLMLLILLSAGKANAALVVVTTTPDLAAIAREVGGASVEVKVLALPTQDPHFVDARPNLALILNKADLLIMQGLDLEIGWLPVLQSGARNPKIQKGKSGFLDASLFVTVLESPAGQVTRTSGGIHSGGNPHYLQDPRNGAKVGRGIAVRLGQIDPKNSGAYEQRAAELERKALAMSASLSAKAAAIGAQKRKIVVYHRSWSYFDAWLGLTEVGAVEPKPGIPPNPTHVAQLLATMRAQKVQAILSEDFYPQTTTKLLADKSGAKLLMLPGGAPDTQGYLDHIQEIAEKTIQALSK